MLEELIGLGEQVFPAEVRPKWLKYLGAARRISSGDSLDEVARSLGLHKPTLRKIAEAPDTLKAVLGVEASAIATDDRTRREKQLGQMLLGVAAENAFVARYEIGLESQGLRLEDLREGRGNSDYHVKLGESSWCQLNIKFHGSRFQKARELVGLDPEDSFALATYKINSALEEQVAKGIPYVFAIIGVTDISGITIGQAIPTALQDANALIAMSTKSGIKKRDFEDAIANHMASTNAPPYPETYRRIQAGHWYMISAAKAMRLMLEKLFQRVYALRVHRFAQNYRTAEVDMHFSLGEDLLPFETFLERLRAEGPEVMHRHLVEGVY
ncbi:hypothetical protein EP7_004359 [Isosphaeraceae bacterium EP7]